MIIHWYHFALKEQRAGRMLAVGSDQKIDGFMARFRDLKGNLGMGIDLQTTFVSVRMSEQVDIICMYDRFWLAILT